MPIDSASLITRLERAATTHGTLTFVGSAAGNGRRETVAYTRLLDEARAVAAALQVRGVADGTHVANL